MCVCVCVCREKFFGRDPRPEALCALARACGLFASDPRHFFFLRNMGALASCSKPGRGLSSPSLKKQGSSPPPPPACRVTTWPKTGVAADFWPRTVAYDEASDTVLVAAGLGRTQRPAGILGYRPSGDASTSGDAKRGSEPRESWWIAGPAAAHLARNIEIDVSPVWLGASPIRGFALVPRSATARFLGARAILYTDGFAAGVADQLWLSNPATEQTFYLARARGSEHIVAVTCDSRGRVATLAIGLRTAPQVSGRIRYASLRAMGDMCGDSGSATIRLLTIASRLAFRSGDHESHTLGVVGDHELPAPTDARADIRSPTSASSSTSASSPSSSSSPSGWELPCAMAFGADDRLYVLDCSEYVGGRALLFRSSAIETDGGGGGDNGGGSGGGGGGDGGSDNKLARCNWTAIADFTAAFSRAEMSPMIGGAFLAIDGFRCCAYVANAMHVHAVRFDASESSDNSGSALPIGVLFAGDKNRRGATDGTRGRAARFSRISGCAIRTRPIDAALDIEPRVAAIRNATANVGVGHVRTGGGSNDDRRSQPQPWPPGVADLVEEYARPAALPAESLVVSDLDNRCVREIHLA